MGAILKPCAWLYDGRRPCGKLSTGTYCPDHRRKRERQRLDAEPWQHLYKDPRWLTARQHALIRDEYRCVHTVGQRRCAVTTLLSVHHKVKLRKLWEQAGKPQRGAPGWAKFVLSACDPRNLETLCGRHHKLADNNNPDEAYPGRQASVAGRRFKPVRRRLRKPRPIGSDE